MELQAGKRWQLTKEDSFLMLASGQVEVYAVTQDKDEFRQSYLLTLEAGKAIFPAMDEFEEIDVLIYAVKDSVLEEKSFLDMDPHELHPLMQEWFKALGELPWLKRLAALGDDMLSLWGSRKLFADSLAVAMSC